MTVKSDDEFFVDVAHTTGAVLVTVSGELDADTAPELTPYLDHLGARSGRVVLDLRGVTFCDSVGLATVVAVVGRGADLRVVGSRPVIRLITLAGMEHHVTFAASVVEALAPDADEA
jgi:anti-sigma B factor antagonist